VRIEETAEAMHTLFKQGKIRAIGVSNFSVDQMEQFRRLRPCMYCSRPIIYLSAASRPISSYCHNNKIATLGYGALCRGLLSGRMRPNTVFDGDDLRRADPKFSQARLPNIWPPWNGSTGSRTAVRQARHPFSGPLGCSIKVSPRRCGARATPASCSQSTR